MSRQFFGDKLRFAMQVGDVSPENDGSRIVDVYAADCWLTRVSNQVYVPHFAGCVADSLHRLIGVNPRILKNTLPYPDLSVADNYIRIKADAAIHEDAEYRAYKFMNWGPTADNVGMLLFRTHDMAHLAFSFVWPDNVEPSERGQVFVAELPLWELATILHEVAWKLMWSWADRSKWR